MNLCFRFLLPIITVLALGACSNEIDVLADYEETASVYALLDPNYSMQFVKINKVFVNPNAKATDVAKIADSLYFDTIAPYIIELSTGRKLLLHKANILLKDSGTFANSPNYLYVTKDRIYPDQKYRLEFILPKSGKLLSAETNVVYTPLLRQPVSMFSTVRIMAILPGGSIPVEFKAPLNGKIYDSYFYFNYVEVNKQDTNIKTPKTISWKVLRSVRSSLDKGVENLLERIPSLLFFDLVKTGIKPDNTVFRRFADCELTLISGNLLLDTYIQASTPSIGIVQKQSDYTNINNGIGLFGSRNTVYMDKIQLSDPTKTYMTTDTSFKKLGFVR